jgi:hypothetical protein
MTVRRIAIGLHSYASAPNPERNTLESALTDDIMTAKMIIDATRPMRRPFSTRLDAPAEVRARFPIEKYFK